MPEIVNENRLGVAKVNIQ